MFHRLCLALHNEHAVKERASVVFTRQKNVVAYVVTGAHISLAHTKSTHSFSKLIRHVMFACVGDLYLSLVINANMGASNISIFLASITMFEQMYVCLLSVFCRCHCHSDRYSIQEKGPRQSFFFSHRKAALRRRKKGKPHKWSSVMNFFCFSGIAFMLAFFESNQRWARSGLGLESASENHKF